MIANTAICLEWGEQAHLSKGEMFTEKCEIVSLEPPQRALKPNHFSHIQRDTTMLMRELCPKCGALFRLPDEPITQHPSGMRATLNGANCYRL